MELILSKERRRELIKMEIAADEVNSAFSAWLTGLDEIAVKYGYSADDGETMVTQTGRDCWKEYYKDGYTPEDAFLEDLSS